MEVKGKVKVINDTQTFDSGFRKKELVITTNEQYPQHLMIEFIQDRVDLLEGLEIGQDVNISINLRGREWINPEGVPKYFNSIQGWRLNKDQNNENNFSDASPEQGNEEANNMKMESTVNEADDDLPF